MKKNPQSTELLVQFLIVAGFVALLAVVSLVQARVSPAPAGTPGATSEATKTPITTGTPDQGTVVPTANPSKAPSTPTPSAMVVATQPFTPTMTGAPTSTVKPTSTRAPTNTPVPQPTQAPTNTANPEATNPPANPTNPIVDIVWQWTSVTNQSNWQTTEIQDPESYTITFHADGSLIGRADCNIFSGVYSQLAGFTIELGPMTMTYCGEGSQDRQFLQLLNEVAAGGPDGQGNLALETAGGEQRMLFENGGTR